MTEMRFTKEHEWIKLEENIAVIGVTDFAQKQLGDIVSIELPNVGNEFKRMDVIGILDSVKASSDIFCPVDGEILEINEKLLEQPELINQSPVELGWIVKIKPLNPNQFNDLLTEKQYNEFIGEN